MNFEVFGKGEIVSFEQLQHILLGSQLEDLDAVYCDDDPEAICMKVVTVSGDEKYLQIGSDNDGSTDLSDERLEQNRFYAMLLPSPNHPEAPTLEELKQLRMKYAVKAMKYKQQEAEIRIEEMKIFNTAPMADALKYYFRVNMIVARMLNEVVKQREESIDNEQM